MHLRHSDHDHGPKTIKIRYVLENPEGMIDDDHFTGSDPNAKEHEFMAAKGEHRRREQRVRCRAWYGRVFS
jgi:hypothetical protein